MKKNNGAISIFALLSMIFFLIFIVVAYNNVSQKSKTQVETQEILVDYYASPQDATNVVKSMDAGTVTDFTKNTVLKETAEQNSVNAGNVGNYIYSNGKIYKVQN